MTCPACAFGDHRVITSESKDGMVKRRRECLQCAHRWTTFEIIDTQFRRAQEIEHAMRHVFQTFKTAVGE